jgi:hypothetical protein
MPCLTNSELIELALATATGGRADSTAAEHARTCSACGRALAEYVSVLDGVASASQAAMIHEARTSCLNDEEVAAFVDGTTPREKRAGIETHITRCGACFERVAELTRLARELDDDRIPFVEFVLRIARDGLSLLKRPLEGFRELELEPVMLLGEPASAEPARNVVAWAQSIGATTLEFTVSKATDDFVDLRVRALAQGVPVKAGRVTLRAGDEIVQSEDLSTCGEVLLQQLEPISYELDITIPQQEHVRCGVTLYAVEGTEEA